MRSTLPLLAGLLLIVPCGALATDLGPTMDFQNPRLAFTRQAGTLLTLETTVLLRMGDNRVAFDFARWDLDPTAVKLQVTSPDVAAQIIERLLPASEPGRVVWTLRSLQAGDCRLKLTCAVKGLEASVQYTGTLAPDLRHLSLDAALTVRSNAKLPLPALRAVYGGQAVNLSALQPGATVTHDLLHLADVPCDLSFVYDNARTKDAVRLVLRLPRTGLAEANALSLPPGSVRVFASGNALVGEGSLPYTPAAEAVEVDLGAVPQVTISRTRLRGDQVNTRSDVYRKAVLFDLDEEFEFIIENRRPAPLALRVLEHPAGEWQVLKASHLWRKVDASTLEFTVPLSGGQKAKLGYVTKRLNVEP